LNIIELTSNGIHVRKDVILESILDVCLPFVGQLGTVMMMGEVSPGPLPLHTRVALPGLVGRHL